MSDIDKKIRFRGLLDEICNEYYTAGKEESANRIATLEAELARVKAERDAAVALLRRVQHHGLDEGASMSKRERQAGDLHTEIGHFLWKLAIDARKEGEA